jgi:Peptidase S46
MMRHLVAALLLAPLAAPADEGMWTYNDFPAGAVERAYGTKVTDPWLKHAQLSSARLAQGCSASFVSGNGLLMTNHHCAHACIEQLSTGERDYVKAGFFARTTAEEVKCPQVEVNQLVEITDVTRSVTEATAQKSGAEFFKARRARTAELEKACQTSNGLRCEVVSLYRGGRYDLYKYRRYQDVRLVFAPEFATAFFGGDPDNFTFPRYDLDVAFLRVYEKAAGAEDARPARVKDFFAWSPAGAKEGELTFVSGHPGATSRQLTVAQLEDLRDDVLPERLLSLAELRGLVTEYQRRGAEQARHSDDLLFRVENSFKGLLGRLEALKDRAFFASKVKAEADFKAALARDPSLAARTLPAFEAVAQATARARQLRRELEFKEGLPVGRLLPMARFLTRAAVERAKPNSERLREYSDAALPQLTQALFSTAPIYPEFEILQLTHRFTKLREKLGPDDPFVKKVLGRQSPAELAEALVNGTRLADLAYRTRLWEGGPAALDEAAKTDAALAFARRIDGDGREVRTVHDETIQPVITKALELIARAHFAQEGTGAYPDATFTLRLSYGSVKGYEAHGRHVAPFTTIGGAFERHTGRDPFALPKSWLDAEARLDKSVPLDFVTTNDIIGGNSGSPVVNARGEIVGLIFDGNLESLGGDFAFDGSGNRAVAVHSSALLEALTKIYGATRIVEELEIAKLP